MCPATERPCRRRDSNPHGLSPRRLRDVRVCHFRHAGTERLRTMAGQKCQNARHASATEPQHEHSRSRIDSEYHIVSAGSRTLRHPVCGAERLDTLARGGLARDGITAIVAELVSKLTATEWARMTLHRLVASPLLVALLGAVALAPRGTGAHGEEYDLVLAGGRVLDPETALDATRNVGIQGGRIAAITVQALAARETLAVHGLVVAPGFIDLHAHGQDSESYRYYAHDGVTTALELEIGTYPVAPWYAERQGHALINYGVSVGHAGARRALVVHDESLPGDAVVHDTSRGWTNGVLPDAELPRLDSLVERGLAEGALAVGFGIEYTPGARREEILRLFRVAARHGVSCFVHLREGGRDPPTGGGLAALQEVIADAAATGASPHVVPVTSIGQRDTPPLPPLLRGAPWRALGVTTEAYPYTAASTAIQSAVFDPGWQRRLGITYHDILYPPTGGRLTAASFVRLRRQGATVVLFIIADSTVRQALADPLVMVASDGISPHGQARRRGRNAPGH